MVKTMPSLHSSSLSLMGTPSAKQSNASAQKGEGKESNFASLLTTDSSSQGKVGKKELPGRDLGGKVIGDNNLKMPPDTSSVPVRQQDTVASPATASEKKQAAENAQLMAHPGGVDPLTRRVALQAFLKKMKDKLNIEPEKLLQAFAKMDPSDLVLPPEQTVDKVIAGLDLKPDQVPMARKLFEDMLRQTASSSMAEYLKSSGNQLSVELVSRQEMKQKALRHSLEKLSEKFFVDGKKVEEKKTIKKVDPNQVIERTLAKFYALKSANGQNNAGAAIPDQQMKEQKDKPMDKGPAAPGQSFGMAKKVAAEHGNNHLSVEGLLQNTDLSTQEQKDKSQVATDPKDDSATVKLSKASANQSLPFKVDSLAKSQSSQAIAGPSELAHNIKNSILNADKNLAGNGHSHGHAGVAGGEANFTQVQNSLQTPVPAVPANAGIHLQSVANGGKNEQANGDDDADTGSQYLVDASGQKSAPSNKVSHNPQFTMNRPQSNASTDSANVREILNQAQFMIRRGGGEMRVKLQPEGMGEVHLKVMVNNGQVNVEMVTDNKDAKHILEKGLADLKATLASHQLNVDGIKVDVGSQLQNQLQRQHDQAERQFAQQFLGQFHQQNDGWRRDFFELPGDARRPSSQTSDTADRSYGSVRPPEKRRVTSSGRLNLVA